MGAAGVPHEFNSGLGEMSDYEISKLHRDGLETLLEELKEIITRLKTFDPDNYISRLLGILNTNKPLEIIDEETIESLIKFIRNA